MYYNLVEIYTFTKGVTLMLSSKFIKFMRALNSGKVENLSCVINLGRVGLRIAEEYSTRFDLLDIKQCLFLSEFQTPTLEKEEKHLLQLIKKHDPLFSLMEYYDNYPYLYSDINFFFKGCLKSGVEISIKIVNQDSKNIYLKTLSKLEKLLKVYNIFMPWLEKKYKINEIVEDLKQHSDEKFNLGNEIRFTQTLNEYLREYKNIDFLNKVRFPNIYAYLSSDDIVVSEYITGTYFYELLLTKQLYYKDILNLIKVQLFFIVKVGVFYNNLHSGNLLISDEGNLHFLDCNTVSVLTPEIKNSFFKILKAFSKKDFEQLAKEFNTISYNELCENELAKLITNIKHSFRNEIFQNSPYFIRFIKTFNIATQAGITFDKEIYPLFKSFIYFNKLLEKVKPNHKAFENDFIILLTDLELIIKNNKNLT